MFSRKHRRLARFMSLFGGGRYITLVESFRIFSRFSNGFVYDVDTGDGEDRANPHPCQIWMPLDLTLGDLTLFLGFTDPNVSVQSRNPHHLEFFLGFFCFSRI